MAVLTSYLPQDTPKEQVKRVERFQLHRQNLLHECAEVVDSVGKNSLPAALKVAIEGIGLTQAQIARDLGVTRSTVMRWASGEAKPLPDATQELVDALVRSIKKQAKY